MNAYQAARCIPNSATVRLGIIRRAEAVAEEYNRCAASGTLESMDVLLFELLQKAKAASLQQDRTRHAILTASITPLCAYYSVRSTPLKIHKQTKKKRKASGGRSRRGGC